MKANQTTSPTFATVLLLLGSAAAVALSCGRTDLVGTSPTTLDQSMGGTYGCVSSGGYNGLGGSGGFGGTTVDGGFGGSSTGFGGGLDNIGMPYPGTGGNPPYPGMGGSPAVAPPVSCPTISTAPGTLNPCGRTIGIAYSPDGQYLATATETGPPNVHIWRLSDGALMYELSAHGDASYAVAFSPDGTMLATAGIATSSWTCFNGRLVPETDATSEVKVWDTATGNPLRNIPVATGNYAYTVKFSQDGSKMVTAGQSGSIEVWDTTNRAALGTDGSIVSEIVDNNDTYYDVQFSPDGSRIVAAGASTGGVWEVGPASPTGSLAFSIPDFGPDMNDAAYSPDGSQIVATGAGGLLRFFDPNGNLQQSFVAHQVNYISRVVWVDNDHVVSDDWGGFIKSWTRDASGQFGASGSWSLGSQAFGIAVSPDGSTLAVGGDGGFMFISYAPVAPAAAISVK